MSHEKEIATFLNDEDIEKIKRLAGEAGVSVGIYLGELVRSELARKLKPVNKGKVRCFTAKS